MSTSRRPSSLETSALLDEPPTSYDSTNDISSDVPPPENSEPLQAVTTSKIHPRILAAMWIGCALAAFDGTVAATLLTPMGSKFNASPRASFIASSYLLSMCCFTPLYGRLVNLVGRKESLLLALSLYGLGTMWCGMAQSMNSVIVGRVIAGMGGGGLPTVSMIIVSDLVEPKKRFTYQQGSTIAFGLGASLGGPIGGWVNDNFGWRWAFYIQAPVIIVGFVVMVTMKLNIPLSDEIQLLTRVDKLRQTDLLGAMTLTGAFLCLFLAVNSRAIDEKQWTHPLIILLFAFSACLVFAFVMNEKHWTPNPVLLPGLILRRATFPIYLSSFFLGATVFSMSYSAPIFFSIVRSHSSTVTGLYLVPHSIFLPTGSLFSMWYMRKLGKLYLVYAALLILLPSVLATRWTKTTPEYHLWLDLIPQAFGLSFHITSSIVSVMANTRQEECHFSITAFYVCRTTGNVTGASLGGAVLQAVLLQKLRARIPGAGSEELIYSIRHSAQIIPSLEPLIRHAAIESYADAMRVVFFGQVAIGLLGVLVCLVFVELRTAVRPMA